MGQSAVRFLRGGFERMEMFPLQLGHFPNVMPLAGSEDND
jgi:hypothetical protein